ncbi:MAG: FAD-binding oxidoreductase [Archaeoglobaceae archaeon]|nr:FAD-binding oxidoreductase [Archaeoglobaceae archaeon]MDW8118030.1 FAD-binding oxidoreductase [Archaeoglobaceae archaeon]
MNKLIERLKEEEIAFSTDKEDLIAYCKDFNPLHQLKLLKKIPPALPEVVVFPKSIEEVSKVLKIASELEKPVYVFGGASGVIDSATPYEGGIALSTLALDWFEIDEKDRLVTAGAGVIGGRIEKILNHKGFSLRHIPQSLFCSTVGGWVATASSGQFSTGYGNIEDLLVSLRVVLPNGEILEERRTPRRAGIDLKKLFVGSEGLLGVIAEATLKIFEIPKELVKISFEYDRIESALEDAKKFLKLKPALMRIFDDEESLRYFDNEAFSLIAIFEGENAKWRAEKAKEKSSGREVENYTDLWLEKRFDVSEISKIGILGFVFDTIEVSCFWSSASKLYKAVIDAIRGVEGTVTASAHASHFYENGLCFYFTFAGFPDEPEKYYKEVWQNAINASLQNGGNITHHHGIGRLRKAWLREEFGSYLNFMKEIKNLVDEKNIMNRGVFP